MKARDNSAQRWKRYTIMQADRRVASIREDGTCTIYLPSFMPYNLYLETSPNNDLNTRLNNLENFYHWCASRVLTLDRAYAKEILNSLNLRQAVTDRERSQIALAYHGLSLTDVFWIKHDRENICFSEINLFTHSLSDAFVDVSLRGKQMTLQNAELLDPKDAAGDVSVAGVAPKAWIRQDDRFYLLKDGNSRDVQAELLASRVARCFQLDQVLYEEDVYKGVPITKSELVTSLDVSISAMEYVDIYAVNHDTNAIELALNKDAYNYYMMNVIDYLVGNTDRHWGNWGFLVDNRTNRLLKLYPLMDFNRAFNVYDTLDGARCLTTRESMSQKDAAIDAVKHIGLNQLSEVQRNWFPDETTWRMFSQRLNLLRATAEA